MLFIPVAILVFIGFALFVPVLFVLGYLKVVAVGFENLGIPQVVTLILLLAILFGSLVNIPIGKRELFYVEKTRFFGLWKRPEIRAQGTAINLGGAVIPLLLALYFLISSLIKGMSAESVFTATLLMIVVAKLLAKVVPHKGVMLPIFAPPVFSAIFSLALAPGFVAPCAFISGVFGTIIGADLFNLRKIQKFGGFISIGGAGVFDGIFLVGIISALLAGF
jgi:uncharacterized membrane protein